MPKLFVFVFALALALVGCKTSDVTYVRLVKATNESVFSEYDEYVTEDEALSEKQKEIRLRLTQTLREATNRKLQELQSY